MPERAEVDYEALSRVIAVMNGKGGVLKTSIVANVGGWMALSGWRVLLIDFDVAGNLRIDLGLRDHPANDRGKGMVNALWMGDPLPIVPEVRPNLDFVFGGMALEMLGSLSQASTQEELAAGSVAAEFARRLGEVAEDYDVVLIDSPPGNGDLQKIILAASRYVLLPTKSDEASLDGLLEVGPRVKAAREENRQLTYLGMVLTQHNPSATRSEVRFKDQTAELRTTVPLFTSSIRTSESTAVDCRALGKLAHELASEGAVAQAARLKALSARRRGDSNVIQMPSVISQSAGGVAEDYRRLAQEIADRIAAMEQTESTGGRA